MGLGELKKRGKDAIRETSEGVSNASKARYTNYISWKAGDSKAVYMITPIDDVPKVMMHNFVKKVVETEDGTFDRWLTFMCRKDPAWRDESGGYCPLCDDIGLTPQERFVALAVEVEPITEGKRITGVEVKYNTGKDAEGNETQYPQVGLIQESAKLFFNYLVAQDAKGRDLENMSWEITREGTGLAKQFIFYPIEHKPDLTGIEKFIPTLESVLDGFGSAERYETEMDGITAENQPVFDRTEKKPTKNGKNDESFEELRESLSKKKKGQTDVIPY